MRVCYVDKLRRVDGMVFACILKKDITGFQKIRDDSSTDIFPLTLLLFHIFCGYRLFHFLQLFA